MAVIEAGATAGARKWWALAGLSLAVLAVALDATALSVALPTLAVSLHASASDLQWFVSAYTLALGRVPWILLAGWCRSVQCLID
jgi:MFS family permease